MAFDLAWLNAILASDAVYHLLLRKVFENSIELIYDCDKLMTGFGVLKILLVWLTCQKWMGSILDLGMGFAAYGLCTGFAAYGLCTGFAAYGLCTGFATNLPYGICKTSIIDNNCNPIISINVKTDSLCDLSYLQNVQILEVFDHGNLKQVSLPFSNKSA